MIFDRQKVIANRQRASYKSQNLKFFNEAANEIVERLKIIDKDCSNILDIGCRWGFLTKALHELYKNSKIISTDVSGEILKSFNCEYKFEIDEENILTSLAAKISDMTPGYFDLISYSTGLHSINNPQDFLKQVHYLLSRNGIFIGNFVGGESLKYLRFKLFEIEEKLNIAHHPHIPPLIHFDHVAPLLQQAGFAEIIVDYEIINLEFASPLKLMHAIKDVGESNFLAKRTNYSLHKSVYYNLIDSGEKFTDQLHLISFIASKSKNTIKLKPMYP